MTKNIQENKDPIFAPRGGKPGYIVNGKWYPVDKQDLNAPQLKAELERYAKSRGKSQLEKDQASLSKPKPEPVKPAQPAPKPATPAPSGSSSRPAPAPAKPSGTTAKPAPTAPKPSPVADYVKAAAAARKSGDPAEMAKVRDMGMEIWRKSNPKLAAAAAERERIRGTAQTDNPLMKDMRSSLPVTPTVQAPAVKDLGSGQQSLSQNKFAGRSPEPAKPVPAPLTISTDKQTSKTAAALSKNPLKKEAYDIVLDYLLSEGHADTISEANYIMLQMSAEHIQNIIEIMG